ncbi:MAG: PIN domain-containing protein [Chitinophagaceae bacterium]
MTPKTFLLIDTDIWKRLVSKTEFSHHLKELDFWITHGYVDLLVPDVLITEWKKHREEELANIETSLKGHKEEARLRKIFRDFSAEFIQQKVDETRQTLRSQLDVIDKLIGEKGLKIETPASVHGMISAQRKAGKRPFWNTKKDHTNDAELIFSAFNYLKEQEQAEFYFLSGNTNEFAKMPETILHSDITDNFQGISCHFYIDFADIYDPFDKKGIQRRTPDFERRSGKVQNSIPVDRTKPVLDQVYDYLVKRFELLHIIPKELFTVHYPFAKADVFPYRPDPYTLVTDNQEVYDLLTLIKIENDEITTGKDHIRDAEDEKKIRLIFRYLADNLVEWIAFKEKDAVPLVYSGHPFSCLCSLCTYKRFQFAHLLHREREPQEEGSDDSLVHQLRFIYGQYKIGRFVEAAKLYQAIFNNYKPQRDIIYYILAFNLRNLAPYLQRDYWDNSEIRKLAGELLKIDLDKVFRECNHHFEDDQLLQYIHEIQFISNPFKRMQEKLNIITDHHYGQNTGFNQNVRRLRELYTTTENFLNQNGIIYDVNGDYESLARQYTMGLLASYGNNDLMSGKLIHFNDDLLNKLLLAGNAEDMQKFLNRFKLKEIEYYQTASDGNTFTDSFEYMLDNHKAVTTIFKSGNDLNKRFFWDSYSQVIYNALTLLAMLKMDRDLINRLAVKSLVLLEEEGELFYFQMLKHFRFFLYRKKDVLSDEVLQSYYKAALKSKLFGTDNFFETIVGLMNDRKIEIELTNEELKVVNEELLDKMSELKTSDWFSVGNIFKTIVNEDQKVTIRQTVMNKLSHDFDAGQYYLATMFEVLVPDPGFQAKYLQEVEKLIEKGQQRRLYVNKEYYTDNRIDNFFNYCLHFGVPVPATIATKAPDMGAYYRWLNDPDNFDYKNFNTDWLYNHFTTSFKRRFRKSMRLKDHLLNIIRTDPDTEIERIFIMIYCFDD